MQVTSTLHYLSADLHVRYQVAGSVFAHVLDVCECHLLHVFFLYAHVTIVSYHDSTKRDKRNKQYG
jgi:hypothetical protein